MNKIIVQKGTDVAAAYADKILLSNVYSGRPSLVLGDATNDSGGTLADATYYYKVVAKCDLFVKLEGDSALQLDDLIFDTVNTDMVYTWKLYSNGTTRYFDLYNGNTRVATGHRTGDGSISFNSVNETVLSGSVTVTFTAADADAGNIITLQRGVFVESEEGHDTTSSPNSTMKVTWELPLGNITSIYVYRGTSAGIYDGYFVLASNDVSFTDDGSRKFDYDTQLDIAETVATRIYLPAGNTQGLEHYVVSKIAIKYKGIPDFYTIDCTKVLNKPTWNAATEVANITAFNEFTSWL